MRRLLVSLAVMLVASACASPLGQPETPAQALAAAAQKTSQLHSAKFDLSGTVRAKFPPQLAQALSQSGAGQAPAGIALGDLTVDLKGKGEAQFPDRLHATVDVKMGGISIETEEVLAAGKAYLRNPVTGKWQVAEGLNQVGGVNQPDPLSVTQLLAAAQSIKDLGDARLGDTDVHHYGVVPDRAKLIAQLDKYPQAQAALKTLMDSGTLNAEVWFGKADHLLRRIVIDADSTIDLRQLFSSLGSAGRGSPALPPGASLPPEAQVHVTGHTAVDYHDFNAPVTVTVPSVG